MDSRPIWPTDQQERSHTEPPERCAWLSSTALPSLRLTLPHVACFGLSRPELTAEADGVHPWRNVTCPTRARRRLEWEADRRPSAVRANSSVILSEARGIPQGIPLAQSKDPYPVPALHSPRTLPAPDLPPAHASQPRERCTVILSEEKDPYPFPDAARQKSRRQARAPGATPHALANHPTSNPLQPTVTQNLCLQPLKLNVVLRCNHRSINHLQPHPVSYSKSVICRAIFASGTAKNPRRINISSLGSPRKSRKKDNVSVIFSAHHSVLCSHHARLVASHQLPKSRAGWLASPVNFRQPARAEAFRNGTPGFHPRTKPRISPQIMPKTPCGP